MIMPGSNTRNPLISTKIKKMVLKPIRGIQYDKLRSFSDTQAKNVSKFIVNNNLNQTTI